MEFFPDPEEPYILLTDVSKQIQSGVLTQVRITKINDKDVKLFLPNTFCQWNIYRFPEKWATLTKEAYMIYMVFKKLSDYLYDANVAINCNHALVHKFLTAYTLNSKVNIWAQRC